MTNGPRTPIDFDAFERDLVKPTAHQAPARAAAAGKADTLAELARIVGQDDPFRQLLEARGGSANPSIRTSQGHQTEPSFLGEPDLHQQPAMRPNERADAFNQYLTSVEQQVHPSNLEAPYAADDGSYGHDQERDARTALATKRRKLLHVGAGVGILVFCVTGALALKGTGSSSSDGPVTVLADKSPLKVAPENADGVEIPDQNKQIYDRNAKDGQIKVVNREEQPIDVARTANAPEAATQDPSARSASGLTSVTPGGGGSLLTESLGEPHRIRTVSVKPDTSVGLQPARQPDQAQPSLSPIPDMTMPDGSEGRPAASAPAPGRIAAASATGSTRSAARMPEPNPSESSDTAQAAPEADEPTRRVANASPEARLGTSEAAASEPAETEAPVRTGGFAVQIGTSNSEAAAKAVFRQMQTKYGSLAGHSPLIRRADVNGQSIYRVRVGPMAKGDATSLCTKLKGAGAQCFIAAN